ncbi:MAG: N-acetyltransferase [candidate division KSB1 bacterium]|nr:N-acetyltransferase [candidate division KSB1 bacterium]
MEVRQVSSRAEERAFVSLPYVLYREDPYWVPPLRSEQRRLFRRSTNPMLQHCDYALFLAWEGSHAQGRVAAFIDQHANRYWGSSLGFFGSYECVDDDRVAMALLGAARDWLTARGMTAMRGPISFESQNWGFIVEGFDAPPTIMSPYNPPFYNRQMEAFGLRKVKDLEVYRGDAASGYTLPERFVRHLARIQQRYDVRVRTVNMRELDREVRLIVELANRSLAHNWGYAPVTEAEAADLARSLKLVLDPSVVFIVEAAGQPIGFSIALPDVNELLRGLNGRLLPFGIFKLLLGMKKVNSYRMWALGIVPEFHRRGIDTLLYVKTYEALKPRGARLEANYVLEDNFAMKDAIIKLGLQMVRRYRVYEMPLTAAVHA